MRCLIDCVCKRACEWIWRADSIWRADVFGLCGQKIMEKLIVSGSRTMWSTVIAHSMYKKFARNENDDEWLHWSAIGSLVEHWYIGCWLAEIRSVCWVFYIHSSTQHAALGGDHCCSRLDIGSILLSLAMLTKVFVVYL